MQDPVKNALYRHMRLRGLLIVALAAAALILLAAVSHAEYEREAAAYKGWKVRGLEVRGLSRSMTSALSKGLFLSTKPAFYPEVLADDIARTRLFMARRGYPYAIVSPGFAPNEAWKDVKVILNVSPGPPVLVSRVELKGFPDDVEAVARGLVHTRPGSIFRDSQVAGSVASMDSLLLSRGYARASVTPEVAALDTTSVSVTYDTEPGMVNYFRNVSVQGAPAGLIALTEKVSDIHRGRRYSPKTMNDARNNLRRLDLYRRVTTETQEAGEDSLDVTIRVAARDPRTLKGTLRYWNDEGLQVGGSWRHRNLFGRGRGFYADAVFSRLLQRLDFSFWWPALVMPRSRETLSLVTERQNEEAYEQTAYGVDLATTYYFTIESNFQVSLSIADVAVTYRTADPLEVDVPTGLLTILAGRLNQNSTDDPFNPRRGFSSWTELRWAPDKVSDNSFIKWEGSGSTYLGGLDPVVLALKLALGAGKATGNSAAIIAGERFYSGGSNSMRGFQRRKLGPKDTAGAPVGGEVKLEASVELRGPLFWRIWGALFADAGQVWLKASEVRLDEIEVAVGPGLLVMTPVGPLRVDAGYRLTRFDKIEPRWAYHFAVGAAF